MRPAPSPWNNGDPIRAELFSVERLEAHARSLAVAQTVTAKPIGHHPLGRRLADNESLLLTAYRSIAKAVDKGEAITPAAEWLIDNYHLVERQVHEIRSALPPTYYRQLPSLTDGPFAGYPRVLGIAWAFIAHTDSRIDSEMLCHFLAAYQEVQPLTIGELWAVAITLRIVLVENLRRLAALILHNRAARQQADDIADRLLGASGRAAGPMSEVMAPHEDTPLSRSFAVQLVHRLRDQDPQSTLPLVWLDERLAGEGTTTDEAVRQEHQRQGAATVTVRNIITSMRLISDLDWAELFERTSLVDRTLAAGGNFLAMDFSTRNLYRSAIEDLARRSGRTELEVAKAAVMAAQQAACSEAGGGDARRCDPGFHLVSGGRRDFEAMIGFQPSVQARLKRLMDFLGIRGYIGAGAIVAAILLALPLITLAAHGLGETYLAVLAILGAIPALDAGVALVNRAVTRGFGAILLPAMALREGVPAHLRTVVAVPTMLTTVDEIEEQVERLEVHYLASPEGALHFALLSDWQDAVSEHADDDDGLLAAAAEAVARLNHRHGPAPGGNERFILLHRRRVWNAGEARWIGWERKRGKLHELNRLLRGATDTNFLSLRGYPPRVPQDVRYVMTLDADTKLPRDTVRRLVGKMAHALNRPRFDAAADRVVEGYAVLQPRVTPSLPVGCEGSLFQRIFSSISGIDPYAAAVSDVYQDLFGEGSYTGKGIYDVDAFEAALAGRVPDSTLLSHDLFEGVFARAGLASDIEVVEEFPARYDVAARRLHRWARGDWQLLPWILGRRPISGSDRTRRSMPAIGRWKMLDNLRRTLSSPACLLALLAGWTLSIEDAAIWTAFILATILVPTLIPVVGAALPRLATSTWRSYLGALGADLRLALILSALMITFLAHQAWLMGDAIFRTLIRLCVTHRHLLEWVTTAQSTIGGRLDLRGFFARMAGAVVIGLLAVTVCALTRPGTLALVVPFAALWIASPVIARWTSRSPAIAGGMSVSESDAQALRLIARQTWRFFEAFVSSTDHMLPPDNFQEDPVATQAHRTSPTNIGLYLVAAATACDFGWVGRTEVVERLEATFATMSRLARFRGHFYNWYDTRDLRPLDPKYISSVDSGNLAGHLMALAGTCREWRAARPTLARRLTGIGDALELAREEADGLRDGPRTQTVTWNQLAHAFAELAADCQRALADPAAQDAEASIAILSKLGARAETIGDIARALTAERGDDCGADMLYWIEAVSRAIDSHGRDLCQSADACAALQTRLAALESNARETALGMEFGFLLDSDRNLLSIGYRVSEGTLDQSCYDLLASEARLASFIAIAKGDIPARHWFHLGRAVTPIAYGAALISWSGSMFEYLMPSLVMRAPAGSLIEQTSRLIVRRQISYARSLGTPWGISESAFNTRDLELTYQYSNFGVPGLGLKRGLAENAVIAPYATALAAMVDPHAAAQNLAELARLGARGRYGFYEALDYTPSRLPEGRNFAIVRAFMAHHQGMTIVAIADSLLDGAMRARFHGEPIVQAAELLLQERTPRYIAVVRPWAAETKGQARILQMEAPGGRRIFTPHDATPATHLLSNGRYAVMLTAAGSGYSRWRDLAVTRWQADATCDDWGSYIFLRDADSGAVWSAGFQPTGVEPDSYTVTFSEDRAEFVRRDDSLITTLEVLVSAEDDAEVRRVSISNSGLAVRDIDVTSYSELVLAPPSADAAHLAFSKLFVETEYLDDSGAILATRRRRAPNDPEIWAAHLAAVDGETVGNPEIETDRARFLGRGHSIHNAIAGGDGRPLSNRVGAVLDPVFALRRRLRLAPGATARITFWTVVASTRQAAIDLIDKHQDQSSFERAATLAWTQAQVQLHHLGINRGEASLFQRLAGHLLHSSPTLRPSSDTILRGCGGQPGLWPLSISGDLPIVLFRIADIEDLHIVRQMLKAHEYWRMKQLAVDLVILNERATSYFGDLQCELESLVRGSQSRPRVGVESPPGRVFVLRADLVAAETRRLLASVARAVLVGQRGRLADQIDRVPAPKPTARSPARRAATRLEAQVEPALPALEFFNGLGGFADQGREYVTILGPGQATPAPWINVIANSAFGFQVATEGSGYSWSVNSRENQLTPWSNDPVTDRSGEAFYLRDDDTGALWSPTAAPIRDPTATYVARHGRGYSRFQHAKHGIELDLLQYVPLGDSIKLSRLTITNVSDRVRHLSVAAYVEWVLGPLRSSSAPFVTTEIDQVTGAMLARNRWNAAFGSRVAFADLAGRQTSWTGDRSEFIGRNGTLAAPAALAGTAALSKHVGAGIDPCCAMQTSVELPPKGAVEIIFFLGDAASLDDTRSLITRYRTADLDQVLAAVKRHWDELLGAVQVTTPDRSMDIMLNGWLLYQTVACRIWARSAFYQASGAYGFRDQLQDGMALASACPAMTREHLLRAAARQFVEGDVQHWWLPHSGQGVRTLISDDRVWLGYAVAHYVNVTGDAAILEEPVPFLEGRKLQEGEHESFFEPTISDHCAPLFEHCARGLDASLAVGRHGLPLIGTGDWNDGMNRVGADGRGESVWLGWLLYATIMSFAPLADARHETQRAASWRAHAGRLRTALEDEGWDGSWYRRAWFDDGTPIGSAASEECRIDSISQSWAVLSGAADPEHAASAMEAVERELLQPQNGLALLFAPPFARTALDPGYVKAYPPGIRENGGQYTHAALWAAMAFAMLGKSDEAAMLFWFLNPINRARTRADVQRYKVEPYVVAGDVYAASPHVGRGGWTWYTGSAGWMQRAGMESILGLRLQADCLYLDPRIPKSWPGFHMAVRHRSSRYEINIDNPDGVTQGIRSASLDGTVVTGRPLCLPLLDDGAHHQVVVRLG